MSISARPQTLTTPYPYIDLLVERFACLDIEQFGSAVRHGGVFASDVLLEQRLLSCVHFNTSSVRISEGAGSSILDRNSLDRRAKVH